MINILIPLGGKSTFFDYSEYQYPKPLIEINGKPMIQLIIENFASIQTDRKFIFIVKKNDCEKFHIDNIIQLLTNNTSKIIKISENTKGAACSALMAIEELDNNNELIIANGDQIVDVDFSKVVQTFRDTNLDAGVITFNSVHPKWSYVRLNEDNIVIETTEKRPISTHAIAGFYYFNTSNEFIQAAFRSISKDSNIDGHYYIAPTLNELILDNKKVGVFTIENEQYHSFYSPKKVKEFENSLKHS